MDRSTFIIKAAFAAFLLSAGSASATLVCPGGHTDPNRGPGDLEYCPTEPTPQTGGDVTNTNTNTNIAGAVAGAAAGAVSGSSSSVGNVSAKGGRGGNASSVSHGGAGGNAKATGGKAVANGGRQRQSQSARTGNIRNVGNTNVESSAASAVAPSIAGCGGTAGGGFSAAIQTFGFGVSAARCKGDRFRQVVEAEELAAQGRTAGMAYLAQVDGSSRKSFGDGVVDIRKDVIATAASAACQVVGRHANGKPKEVRAYPKPGRTADEALASCLSVRGLFLVSP